MTTMAAAPERTYPAAEWVRAVTFLDVSPDTSLDSPVHLAQRVLINGQPSPLRINLREPWSITNAGLDGTIVSFLIHPDDVTMERVNDAGEHVQRAAIGAHKVLTPVDRRWVTEHTVKPTHGTHPASTLTNADEPVWDWVRVYFFARSATCASARP